MSMEAGDLGVGDKEGLSRRFNGSGQDIEAPVSVPSQPEEKDAPEAEPVEEIVDVGYKDIAKQFSLLGWTAFGGPSAHIALFEKVGKSAWPIVFTRNDYHPRNSLAWFYFEFVSCFFSKLYYKFHVFVPYNFLPTISLSDCLDCCSRYSALLRNCTG